MNELRNPDEVFAFLCETIEDLVDVDTDQLKHGVALDELDLISLDYVEINVLVKKRFKVELSMELLVTGEISTLGDLADYIVKYEKVS